MDTESLGKNDDAGDEADVATATRAAEAEREMRREIEERVATLEARLAEAEVRASNAEKRALTASGLTPVIGPGIDPALRQLTERVEQFRPPSRVPRWMAGAGGIAALAAALWWIGAGGSADQADGARSRPVEAAAPTDRPASATAPIVAPLPPESAHPASPRAGAPVPIVSPMVPAEPIVTPLIDETPAATTAPRAPVRPGRTRPAPARKPTRSTAGSEGGLVDPFAP